MPSPADPSTPTPSSVGGVALVRRDSVPDVSARLQRSGIDPLLADLFASRGVKSAREVRGEYIDLLPVHTMKNVMAMASYLADAQVQGRRVLIVSDYDCDGATACAVLHVAFSWAGMNYDFMVPDRFKHGYGLTPSIVDEAAALPDKPDVIITVDNGISSVAGVQRANDMGIDVLVTDHHLAPAQLPDAKLIVNPNQPGCEFASKDIAGCGVAWYVARALLEEMTARGHDCGYDPAELLSYVAIGTVADVVRLDRNNRILVRLGLDLIRQEQCAPGVVALARRAGKSIRTLSCSDIGFGIGPRINAAGRLSHMSVGIDCLTSMDADRASKLAKVLHDTNDERKDIQKEIVDQALIQAQGILNSQAAMVTRRSIVLHNDKWHEGVIGIVAGRLKEERHRPTIVMTRSSDGEIKGSGRSIPGFHLKHALDAINVTHPGLLQKFGGHAMAAGLTIRADGLRQFEDALEAYCAKHLPDELLTKKIFHDGPIAGSALELDSLEMLSKEVWGQGFEEPVFVNEVDVLEAKALSNGAHIKVSGEMAGAPVEVMMFGQGDLYSALPTKLVVAHKPGISNFRGERTVQALVEHIPMELNPSLAPALRARYQSLSSQAKALSGTDINPTRAPEAAQQPGHAQGALQAIVAPPTDLPAAKDQSTEDLSASERIRLMRARQPSGMVRRYA
ncbi:MAG: single-stranded-DNA-specific exonuclease RecJ [Polaromonas sp.]|nr:single-stranded-DNA-specific exonuclease RecJ [Polaromonas sp.]